MRAASAAQRASRGRSAGAVAELAHARFAAGRVLASPARVEMHWRQPGESAAAPVAMRPAPETWSRPAASPAATGEVNVPAHAQAAARPTLDRDTLDRLAEDVIRRVERQVRIERERRGL